MRNYTRKNGALFLPNKRQKEKQNEFFAKKNILYTFASEWVCEKRQTDKSEEMRERTMSKSRLIKTLCPKKNGEQYTHTHADWRKQSA